MLTINVKLYGIGKGLIHDGPLDGEIEAKLSAKAKANMLELQEHGLHLEIEEFEGGPEYRFSATIGDNNGDYACGLLPNFPDATNALNKFLEEHTYREISLIRHEEISDDA